MKIQQTHKHNMKLRPSYGIDESSMFFWCDKCWTMVGYRRTRLRNLIKGKGLPLTDSDRTYF